MNLNGRIVFAFWNVLCNFLFAACGYERSCSWMSEVVAVSSAWFIFSVSLFSLVS
jgi:hypothetical protein